MLGHQFPIMSQEDHVILPCAGPGCLCQAFAHYVQMPITSCSFKAPWGPRHLVPGSQGPSEAAFLAWPDPSTHSQEIQLSFLKPGLLLFPLLGDWVATTWNTKAAKPQSPRVTQSCLSLRAPPQMQTLSVKIGLRPCPVVYKLFWPLWSSTPNISINRHIHIYNRDKFSQTMVIPTVC